MAERDVAVGVDVGTQGARAVAIDLSGQVLARGSHGWPLQRGAHGWHEQDPQTWLAGVIAAVARTVAQFESARVRGIAVTATSGSLVLADAEGAPVRPAIMWDDTRAVIEADELRTEAWALADGVGLRLRPSYPLAKLAWLQRHESDALRSAAHLMHQSDWLLFQLGTSPRAFTDPTNALKTGYDPIDSDWLPVLHERGWASRLPEVVPAGSVIGNLAPWFAELVGLDATVSLVTGMTDANSATLAAGLVRPGEWSVTLGTGLSLKARSEDVIGDASAGVYSHAHPFGGWLVSGTTHIGGGAVSLRFGTNPALLDDLAQAAQSVKPGEILDYPLVGEGDFFPFWAPHATAFRLGEPAGQPQAFRATLEGVAVVERLAVDRLRAQGAPAIQRYVALGGATRSALWNRIRAAVLDTPVDVSPWAESAVGAAMTVVAAHGARLEAVFEHARVNTVTVEPDPALVAAYIPVVARYVDAFAARGYLDARKVEVGNDQH